MPYHAPVYRVFCRRKNLRPSPSTRKVGNWRPAVPWLCGFVSANTKHFRTPFPAFWTTGTQRYPVYRLHRDKSPRTTAPERGACGALLFRRLQKSACGTSCTGKDCGGRWGNTPSHHKRGTQTRSETAAGINNPGTAPRS